MADASLDEFFARKDKSKRSKAKSKFTTTETIAKRLEESGKKSDFVKKDIKEKITLSSSNHSTNAPTGEQEDDEWKNIEDEKERDYSGLRVQALSISEREKEEEQLKEQMAEHSEEILRTSDAQSGPWKIVSVPTPAPVEEERQSPEREVKEVKPMAYKPPALRNASASNSPSNSSSSRRHPKSAPQISSELHFPSLSSAAKAKYSDADRSFQSVKHGIRSKGDSQPGLQLDLENKFSALHHGD